MLISFFLVACSIVWAQNAAAPIGLCTSTSGSSTAYTCMVSPLLTYVGNVGVNWKPDVTNSTATPTLDLGPGVKNLKDAAGNNLAVNALLVGAVYSVAFDGTNIRVQTGPGAINIGIPAGTIVLSLSACATGFSEVAALNGKTLIGTLAANGNVGTTGGADTITPAGTVAAPIFTGSPATSTAVSAGTPAGTVSAPTFAGAALPGHAHELPIQFSTTDTQIRLLNSTVFGTGTSRAAAVQWTRSNNTTVAPVMLNQSVSAGTPSGTNSAPIFAGSLLPTHTHTVTPSGTNSAPGFSGTSFDNRSAFIRVIFCSKN